MSRQTKAVIALFFLAWSLIFGVLAIYQDLPIFAVIDFASAAFWTVQLRRNT